MPQATFIYEGVRIRATLDSEADLEWLKEFLVPWFDLVDADADLHVTAKTDHKFFQDLKAKGREGGDIRVFTGDTKVTYLPTWLEGQEIVGFYDQAQQIFYRVEGNSIQLIYGGSPEKLRMRVMRTIRELAMGAAQQTGGRFLHASSFTCNGRAAIITGPRNAGKTSLLSYVTSHSKANFLTNDRLLVDTHEDVNRLRGMPTIVSVRSGTLSLMPKIRQLIEQNNFYTLATITEASQAPKRSYGRSNDQSYSVSPRQFCRVLNCEPVRDGIATLLLFPHQTGTPGGIALRRVTPALARLRLKECLFGHIGPDRLSEALTVLPARFKQETALHDDELIATLAKTLPAFDCELGTESYRDASGAKMLLQTLGDHAGPAASQSLDNAQADS